MDKVKRNERIAAITRVLVSQPNRVVGFSSFCDRFGAAKSSISEDVGIIDAALRAGGLGSLNTLAGAAGGVRFRPAFDKAEAADFLSGVADTVSAPERLLPGGYVYLSDILSDPAIAQRMGEIIAGTWYDHAADFVLTMEAKGIPVAMMAAHALGIPLVIARRQSKVYEGSAVNISYISGRGSIENMSLSRRAVQPGRKALIVDDFIRGGGTARGLFTLMAEFSCPVVGMSFVLAQDEPTRHPMQNERSLMVFTGDGTQELLRIRPADWLRA